MIEHYLVDYMYVLVFLALGVGSALGMLVRGISEIFIFVGILSLAIVYAWVKGVFTWPNRRKVY
ncbi:MAG: hypothetical protein LC645_04245 [Geobacteraceae bacterium]|nr:hypothetical protein [Geobacteraceae bacterium]